MPEQINIVRDHSGAWLQSLATNTERAIVSLSGSSQRLTVPTDARVVRLASSGNCWFLFGDGTVTVSGSTGHLFPAGTEVQNVPPGATHVAIIQEGTATGNFCISRMR